MASRRSVLAFLGLAPVAALVPHLPATDAALADDPVVARANRLLLVDEVDGYEALGAGPMLTPRLLRAIIVRDLRGVTLAELQGALALFLEADILPGTWIPLAAQSGVDA